MKKIITECISVKWIQFSHIHPVYWWCNYCSKSPFLGPPSYYSMTSCWPLPAGKMHQPVQLWPRQKSAEETGSWEPRGLSEVLKQAPANYISFPKLKPVSDDWMIVVTKCTICRCAAYARSLLATTNEEGRGTKKTIKLLRNISPPHGGF